jgi:hypothetical protein
MSGWDNYTKFVEEDFVFKKLGNRESFTTTWETSKMDQGDGFFRCEIGLSVEASVKIGRNGRIVAEHDTVRAIFKIGSKIFGSLFIDLIIVDFEEGKKMSTIISKRKGGVGVRRISG